MALRIGKKKRQHKILAAAISISKREGTRVKTLYHQSENHKPFYSICPLTEL